ncbi:MAG: anthranilate synthase component I [Actinobacteria bacterium]|nr:MAG: anthranilate synthase component I [Actinomycetota bacterium]
MPSFQPSRDEFLRLASEYTLVPVWREVLGDLETPVGVYRKLGAEPNSFLLESVEQGERWGRYSFIGLNPFTVMTARDGAVTFDGEQPPSAADAPDPLTALERALFGYKAPALPGLPPLHGGAVGYVGYDVVRYIERLPQTTTDDLGLPELWLLFTGQLLVFDHLRQRLSVISNVVIGDDPAAQYDDAVARAEALVTRIGAATGPGGLGEAPHLDGSVGEIRSNQTPADYMAKVERAKEHIAAGDIFQVVPSQRFETDTTAQPFDVYRVLRLVNPSPYMFYLQFPDVAIVGSSPEPHLRVFGREATIRPIAGTRPRGNDVEEDEKLAADLIADEKERAEHVMLVDLARNDLGRVCEPGTVRVEELMQIERYSHVMHIVSSVRGELAGGMTAFDALKASFPAGTVSGAPKIRAMEIIDDLEPTRRGPYAGAVGYFDFSGNLDTCIGLRTGYLRDGKAYLQAGAGIVADSVPEREEQETRDKARAFFVAVKAAESLS